jgi:putative CocE/NonD family hydrolase
MKTTNIIQYSLVLILLAVSFSIASETADSTKMYGRTEAMIPMRDGIRLFTIIYAPKKITEPLPILLSRTPYGAQSVSSPEKSLAVKPLSEDGYIFVYQDIRGRYKSEGTFEMFRAGRDKRNPQSVDECTDAYDTIEWLIHHLPATNGNVGMMGTSYAAWTAIMGIIEPHPALRTVIEMATPSDQFLGDDFHHHGAFRLSYGFEYSFMEEASQIDSLYPFGMYDTYDWYRSLGPLSNVNLKYFNESIPTWNNFIAHPNYDAFWKKQSLLTRLPSSSTIPILHVAGWWDQEDFYGPLKAYELLEQHDSLDMNYLLVGPWNHGGWAKMEGNKLGRITFDTATGRTYRESIQRLWLAFYLKGRGEGTFPEAKTFQTGSNRWKEYGIWPPLSNVSAKILYLHKQGGLSFNPPDNNGDKVYDEYISDPNNPIPYRLRPIEHTYGPGSRWSTWLVEDQRFVHHRPDVVSWVSAPLTEDLSVTGNVTANLFAATSGTDCDWIVKLIDVYPDTDPKELSMSGYQLMVANEVFRARFRNSYETPEPVTPGAVVKYAIDMRQIDHCFRAGHRIMVQVQSTWFPLIDRNPQKYIPNIFHAKESDFQTAKQKIYRSPEYPSHIVIPVQQKN